MRNFSIFCQRIQRALFDMPDLWICHFPPLDGFKRYTSLNKVVLADQYPSLSISQK
ncbi:hypothetical protein CHELA20_53994 [Hyphomicrobiales bacterium]|nr:hypothetical protein CHELA41_20932 [Hyphomicrobiales bacterium]CAH1685376.1 hypothetical protein CHELA20_53994 [Hyphomicrobiales bacterium]